MLENLSKQAGAIRASDRQGFLKGYRAACRDMVTFNAEQNARDKSRKRGFSQYADNVKPKGKTKKRPAIGDECGA